MQFVPPTVEETAAVSDLKTQLSDANVTYPFTDIAILRFLRGRNHVTEKALNGLIKHVEWRKTNNVDSLLTNTASFETEMEQRKVFNEGFDLLQRPIVNLIARRHNKDKRDIDVLQSYIIYTLETAMTRVRKDDEKIVIVFDLSQFSLTCMDYEAVKLLVHILQYNYPEILSCALIINSPIIFSACWQIIRLMIDPVTASKCIFLKPSQLKTYIDVSEISPDIVGVSSLTNSPSMSKRASSDTLSDEQHKIETS
jgi:CRAL/TRIO domain